MPFRGFLIGFALAALVGCSGDTDIIGRCEAVSDAVRATDDQGGPGGPRPSVGLLDDAVLVSWESFPGRAAAAHRWLDADLTATGDTIYLGLGAGGERTRWVNVGDAIVGQTWLDPEFREIGPPGYQQVYVATLRPALAPALQHVSLSVAAVEPAGSVSVSVDSVIFSAGWQRLLPGVGVEAGFRAAVVARPGICGSAISTHSRLHLFGDGMLSARPVLWGDDPCDGSAETRLEVSDIWLIALEGDEIAVLARLGGTSDGRVYLLRVSADGTLEQGPILVGADIPIGGDGGWQPHGVLVPDERILFTERRATTNACHGLRLVDTDGTDAHDTPWQMPCMRHSWIATATVELLSIPGGAVLVWGERPRNLNPVTLSQRDTYREAIYAVLLTPDGRRGSEIVEVTDDAATILAPVPSTEDFGPYPADFLFGAASNGDEVVVAWHDTRLAAPGIYARRLRCRLDAEM